MARKIKTTSSTAVSRRAIGYVRVSTNFQATEGDSLSVQIEMLKAAAKLEGLDLVQVFVEEGVSGGKPLAERPEGAKLMAAVQAGDTVLALKLDRLFRDVGDAANTLAEFKRIGVALWLRDLGGLVTGSVGALVFNLLSSVASFERERIGERIRDTKRALKTKGRFVGGSVTFAHTVETREDGERYLVADTKIIESMKDLQAKGYSTRLIAGHLAQQGIKVSHMSVGRALRRLAA
jgi:DNA invertase Pin-like site-specific DNA recombinase